MVVLGASVLTKAGKVLLSRHFVEMHRVRIEGLLAAFPKLISGASKQHTFVETESVRYVYQPMDTLYLVIITNKSSNIIEDLETLRLLAKLIPEYCSSVDEDGVVQSQFELVFAFDEAVALGYRENVKPEQIRVYTEMDSHEEKLHNMVQKHREEEALRLARQRANELAAKRAANKGQSALGVGGGMGGGGGGDAASSGSNEQAPQEMHHNEHLLPPIQSSTPAPRSDAGPRTKGMQLSKHTPQSKASHFLDALKEEGELKEAGPKVAPARPSQAATPASVQSLHIAIEEKVNAKLDREGGLKGVEVLGCLLLSVQDEAVSRVVIQCTPLDLAAFQAKVNPKLNKDAFNKDGRVELNDAARGHAVANSQLLVKWRMAPSLEEDKLPLMVNCWPSEIDGGFSVNLDYELTMPSLSLTNVIIGIPLSDFGSSPAVIQSDGDAVFDPDTRTLMWHVTSITTANSTGTLEFEVRGGADTAAFFPINVSFSSPDSYSGVKLVKVCDAQSGADVPHSAVHSLVADQYVVA